MLKNLNIIYINIYFIIIIVYYYYQCGRKKKVWKQWQLFFLGFFDEQEVQKKSVYLNFIFDFLPV